MYNLIWEEIRMKRQIKFQRIIIKFNNTIGFRVKGKVVLNPKENGFAITELNRIYFSLKITEILRGYSGWQLLQQAKTSSKLANKNYFSQSYSGIFII